MNVSQIVGLYGCALKSFKNSKVLFLEEKGCVKVGKRALRPIKLFCGFRKSSNLELFFLISKKIILRIKLYNLLYMLYKP